MKIYAEKILPEELMTLPVKSFEGTIEVVDTLSDIGRICELLKECKMLGFDTESRPMFKKGMKNRTALLQFSANGIAYLFRLNHIGLPDEICGILSNPEIIKVGAAIKDDINILQKIKSFVPAGFIDIHDVVKDYEIEDRSIKKLAGIVLGIRISKQQQLSNWEVETLSNAQQLYAATDAWVCSEIYKRLKGIV